jgi:hypothetical protein
MKQENRMVRETNIILLWYILYMLKQALFLHDKGSIYAYRLNINKVY